MSSEVIWYEEPKELFTKTTWTRFVPIPSMTTTEALNAVVRFTVYFSVLLFVATQSTNYLMLIPVVLALTYVLHMLFPNGKKLEAYMNGAKRESFTMPTANNPFMNVLLTDIQDNPDRDDAAPVSKAEVRAQIAKAFQHTNDLYMDTSDMFDQAQAMRTFHTIQSAKVPNDQDAFLAWLAKGYDEPDYSSAPLARGGKFKSEGYTPARGSMDSMLPSTTAKPRGTTPTPATLAK
jgi:hypothetical protein